jgi:hypothetical protein
MKQTRDFEDTSISHVSHPVKIIASVHSESHETPHALSPSWHLPDTTGYPSLNDSNCRSLRERTRRRSAGSASARRRRRHRRRRIGSRFTPPRIRRKTSFLSLCFLYQLFSPSILPYSKPNQDEDLRWLRRNKQQSR